MEQNKPSSTRMTNWMKTMKSCLATMSCCLKKTRSGSKRMRSGLMMSMTTMLTMMSLRNSRCCTRRKNFRSGWKRRRWLTMKKKLL